MNIRPARASDFAHLETFVWQAIFPAFDVPGLGPEERAENDATVSGARAAVERALVAPDTAVFVATDPRSKTLAGYVIANAAPAAYAEIETIVVKRAQQGKGLAARLLAEATNFIGRDRAVSLAVRHYNGRAKAFFAKHDFTDTGETTGDFAIPRTLMLREAYEDAAPAGDADAATEGDERAYDFPSDNDEPVFERLPDHTLSVDEEPLFQTGANRLASDTSDEGLFSETTLDDAMLGQLEAFIAQARQRKARGRATAPPPAPARREIPFEVDFGDVAQRPEDQRAAAAPPPEQAVPSFEFAFEDEAAPGGRSTTTDAAASQRKSAPAPGPTDSAADAGTRTAPTAPVGAAPGERSGEPERSTTACDNCATTLPAAARFCFNCGHPQTVAEPAPAAAPTETVLELTELPPLPPTEPSRPDGSPVVPVGTAPAEEPEPTATECRTYLLADLKQRFRSYLEDRLIAYFGAKRLPEFRAALEDSNSFQQLRNGSLTQLTNWLNATPRTPRAAEHRIVNTIADLTEYFVVETAADLTQHVLPQRLLRHQSVDWTTVDLFRLVMDYLDFDAENEVIYTDFVAMPQRAMKNAVKSFLAAGKDERVFFICDQSLISQAKNGFALTDAGVYWKNVLQPAGGVLYNTLNRVAIENGHLTMDGQYFNAGGRLNLKLAVLLDKLRRMG